MLVFDPISEQAESTQQLAIEANQRLFAIVNEVKRLRGDFGTITFAAPINMGGNRITNLGAAASNSDASQLSQGSPTNVANLRIIQQQLMVNGAVPLNVAQLAGSASALLEGARATRPDPKSLNQVTFYFETDNKVLDVLITSATPSWQYVAGVIVGTFSARPSTGLLPGDAGLMFAASDQNNVTWRWDGAKWVYWSGRNNRTQAQLAALAALLGANDTGYQVAVTDYFHQLEWTGAGWQFVEGDLSEYVTIGGPGGGAPLGGLWGICDGSAYNILQGDGTLALVTTQNLTGNVFVKGAATVAAQRAADRAKWEAAAVTDNESAHTHAIVNTINVTTGGGANNAAAAQTTSGGSAHHHVLSDANAQLKVFNETNGGLPLSIQVVFYIRR